MALNAASSRGPEPAFKMAAHIPSRPTFRLPARSHQPCRPIQPPELDPEVRFDRTLEKFATTLCLFPIFRRRFRGFSHICLFPPGDGHKAVVYFGCVLPPKSLEPEEFVIDPAPARRGGTLDP
jgi:hypothetical protein